MRGNFYLSCKDNTHGWALKTKKDNNPKIIFTFSFLLIKLEHHQNLLLPVQLYNNQITKPIIKTGMKLSMKTYAAYTITGNNMTRLILRRLPLDVLFHNLKSGMYAIPS